MSGVRYAGMRGGKAGQGNCSMREKPWSPFLIAWVCIVFGLLWGDCQRAWAYDGAAGRASRPNVIWIVLDALRADSLSCYGYERSTTPNVDRLAESGVLFERHYTQGLWTSISVPSYMTGRYFPVLVHEPVSATEAIRKVPPGERLLPEILKENGYTTKLVSAHSWFTPSSRLWQAFDAAVFVEPAETRGLPYAEFKHVNEAILSWLRTQDKHRPFFVYVHTMDTHFPHRLAPPYDTWIDRAHSSTTIRDGQPVSDYGCVFSEKDKRHLRGLYDGSVLYADAQIGILLEALETMGLRQSTVLIVGSDHGELLGEDGTNWGHRAIPTEQLMHVPLILAGPGVPSGVRVTELTENADIVPSLMALLGLKGGIETDGKSILPLISTEKDECVHRYVFSKFVIGGYDGAPCFILRDKEFQYEYCPADQTERFLRLDGASAARSTSEKRAGLARTQMKRHVLTKITPLWRSYMALPFSTIQFSLHQSIETAAAPKDAYRVHQHVDRAAARTDNKWGYDLEWRQLWTRSWDESVPPITFRYGAANGLYVVQLELFVCDDYHGHRASSVRVKVEDDKQFKTVEKDDAPPGKPFFAFVDVGQYMIEDGTFDITLEQGKCSYWAIVRSFRLLPVSDAKDGTNAADQQARMERLRALGYIE